MLVYNHTIYAYFRLNILFRSQKMLYIYIYKAETEEEEEKKESISIFM